MYDEITSDDTVIHIHTHTGIYIYMITTYHRWNEAPNMHWSENRATFPSKKVGLLWGSSWVTSSDPRSQFIDIAIGSGIHSPPFLRTKWWINMMKYSTHSTHRRVFEWWCRRFGSPGAYFRTQQCRTAAMPNVVYVQSHSPNQGARDHIWNTMTFRGTAPY